jgi:DNA polymerase III subunit beta
VPVAAPQGFLILGYQRFSFLGIRGRDLPTSPSRAVEVAVRNGEVGEAHERLPTTSEDEFHISFNPSYLLDGVSAVDSEKVLFKLNDPFKSGLIVPKTNGEEPDFLYLITPMRDSSSS